MASLELRFPPLLVCAVFAAAMWGLTLAAPDLSVVLPDGIAIALTLSTLGSAVAAAGVMAFRAQHTTVNPLDPGAASSVVERGIYRFTRNPMYLGFAFVLAGWAAYLSNALAALLLPAFVAYLNRFQIKPEERALLTKFGLPFAQYMSRVRRWI